MKLKNKEYRKWMKTRTEGNRIEYVNARNHAEDVKRRNKDITWRRIGRELKEDTKGTGKLLYGMAKSMRGNKEPEMHTVLNKEGKPLLEEEEVTERWSEYFEELLNVEEGEEEMDEIPMRVRQEHEEIRMIEIEEVKEAIKILKNGKSPGYDGLNNELFRTVEGLTKWLTRLLIKPSM